MGIRQRRCKPGLLCCRWLHLLRAYHIGRVRLTGREAGVLRRGLQREDGHHLLLQLRQTSVTDCEFVLPVSILYPSVRLSVCLSVCLIHLLLQLHPTDCELYLSVIYSLCNVSNLCDPVCMCYNYVTSECISIKLPICLSISVSIYVVYDDDSEWLYQHIHRYQCICTHGSWHNSPGAGGKVSSLLFCTMQLGRANLNNRTCISFI